MRADGQAGLEFFNACHRLPEILILHQSLVNEPLQFLVVKELPPGKIGDGLPFCLRHAKLFACVDRRPGIVGPHGAGCYQQDWEQ